MSCFCNMKMLPSSDKSDKSVRYPVAVVLHGGTSFFTTVSLSFPTEYSHLNNQVFFIDNPIILRTTNSKTEERKMLYFARFPGDDVYTICGTDTMSAPQLKIISSCDYSRKREELFLTKYDAYKIKKRIYSFDSETVDEITKDFAFCNKNSTVLSSDSLSSHNLPLVNSPKGKSCEDDISVGKKVTLHQRADLTAILSPEFFTCESGTFRG